VTVLGIDHVGITVESIEATLVFYRDLLGLSLTDEGEDSGPELDAITGLTGVRIRYADPGASHLALRVDDVDALCERLATAGVKLLGRPTTITAPGAWHGARCVYVEDPDGRAVELVERTR
jgi:catechol 2,3-dioxygenase-like lactoylglutathione lyase family enzyme